MKINNIKSLLLAVLTAGMFTSCVGDDDTSLPNYTPVVFGEDFEANVVTNEALNLPGWLNYAEQGTAVWKSQYHSGANYAEFTSRFFTSDLVNVAWLISPSIDMDAHENEKLVFQSSQNFVINANNSLEALISTDFDGTNVTTAHWTKLDAVLPTTATAYYLFVDSGEIDLSSYTGKINIAFRVKGSGINTDLDGTYQLDNIRIFY